MPQETLPQPPADRTLIYVLNDTGALAALPFEAGTTPLRVDTVAGSDKSSYVDLKGERASFVINTSEPRLFLFVKDDPNSHPPLVVRLTDRHGARRVTVFSERGRSGFAIAAAEIVKPHYRVIARDGGMLYMEVRPREPLMNGEYAIVGADLQRIATFRVVAATKP